MTTEMLFEAAISNRNPRKPSHLNPFGFDQLFHRLSSASNVLSIPQFPDEHSQCNTKFVP